MRYYNAKVFEEKSKNTLDKNGGFVNSLNLNKSNALGQITPLHSVCANFVYFWGNIPLQTIKNAAINATLFIGRIDGIYSAAASPFGPPLALPALTLRLNPQWVHSPIPHTNKKCRDKRDTFYWSEWRDLNPWPLRPERSALPGWATLRKPIRTLYTLFSKKIKRIFIDFF